jgi:hypothetical protein
VYFLFWTHDEAPIEGEFRARFFFPHEFEHGSAYACEFVLSITPPKGARYVAIKESLSRITRKVRIPPRGKATEDICTDLSSQFPVSVGTPVRTKGRSLFPGEE